jgi:hypothetical protein
MKGIMNAFNILDTSAGVWNSDSVLDDYKELVDYDSSRNLMKYLARGIDYRRKNR